MRICPKCSKQVSDGRKICRDCGAILAEVEDKASTEGTPPEQSDPSLATEEKQDLQRQADASVDTSEDGDDCAEAHEDQSPHERAEDSPWTCEKCGECVPETFDVCWKCGTTREGFEDPGFVTERLDADEDVQPEAASESDDHTESKAVSHCTKCGSAKIVPDVRLNYNLRHSIRSLPLIGHGNPDALFFKDDVEADICGDCGHIELRVRNPRELFDHYLDSLDA